MLMLTLAACALPAASAGPAAAAEPGRWSKVNIPTEGSGGQWVLADGSDVRSLTLDADGALYAYAPGLTYTLYRSADGGRGWEQVGNVQHSIVAIAVSPQDTAVIYYATATDVYRSANGGRSFSALPDIPGGTGGNNVAITSLDAAYGEANIIAVGTRDSDSAEYGGVYTLDEAAPAAGWEDTGLGGYDVYAVAFSPGYAGDRQLVAVATDETDTIVTSRTGTGGWGDTLGNATLNVAVAVSAAVAFPANYDPEGHSGYSELFVGIDTGSGLGDVYKITGADAPSASTATDLNVGEPDAQANTDITGLAGAADSAEVYRSEDGGQSWSRSRRPPSGATLTEVVATPGFAETGLAYAATSGAESAFSLSEDGGQNWEQASLVDTTIVNLLAAAPSPQYGQDHTIFLLSFGGKHSLWRSTDGGTAWTRPFSSAQTDVDSISLIALPPDYDSQHQTVFAAGQSGGSPAFWKSEDNGQTFRRRPTRDPDTGAAIEIDAWALIDEDSLFIAGYDGSHAMVYRVTASGFSYSESAPAGGLPLQSLALSPDYAQDETVLAGSTGGYVYWSADNGATFEPLPADASSAPLSGAISVAFDPNFAENRTVYAASDSADEGIYRFVVGSGSDWRSIDGSLPSDATLSQLISGGSGALYAANTYAGGGLERCLNPAYPLGPSFETVSGGLAADTALSGLWQAGPRLWSLDTANNRLLAFHDTLTEPVILKAPADGAAGAGNLVNHAINNVSLDWETLEGATSYQWQLDADTDLSSVPSGFEATTQASSAAAPVLQPDTTYYWRVRASAPVYSPWSAKQSFTTSLDTATATLSLQSPAAGATDVPVKPVFQWAAVAGASQYDLLVAADSGFDSPVIVRTGEYALPATAWECDVTLDYATTYYWRVRAVSAASASAWSAAGAFTTRAAGEPLPVLDELPDMPPVAESPPAVPTATPAPPKLTPPPPSPLPQTPDALLQRPLQVPVWVIYLIGGLLLVILLTLVIILAMVFSFRRL